MLWHTQCTCMYPSTHKVKQVSETFVPERPTLSLSGPLPFPVWSRILSVYEGKGLCFRSPEWMSVSEEMVLFTTWIHWPAFMNHRSGGGGVGEGWSRKVRTSWENPVWNLLRLAEVCSAHRRCAFGPWIRVLSASIWGHSEVTWLVESVWSHWGW